MEWCPAGRLRIALVVASEKSEAMPACRAVTNSVTVNGGGAGVGSGDGIGAGVGGAGTAAGVVTSRFVDKAPTVTVIELVLPPALVRVETA